MLLKHNIYVFYSLFKIYYTYPFYVFCKSYLLAQKLCQFNLQHFFLFIFYFLMCVKCRMIHFISIHYLVHIQFGYYLSSQSKKYLMLFSICVMFKRVIK